jgi:carboxyl-terminal processing protease
MRCGPRLPAILLATLFLAGPWAPAQETQDKVDKIFDRIEESRGAGLWQAIRDLEEMGRGSVDQIRKGLTRSDPFVRLAVAKVLYTRELREEALDALSKIMSSKSTPAKRAAADIAAQMVGQDKSLTAREKQQIASSFEKQALETDDPIAQISLWRAVWNLTGSMKPIREVRTIHAQAEKGEIKEEAALALAEMDRFIDAKATLTELAKEPSDRGRMARSYLKVNELSEDLSRKPPTASKYDFKQLEEAIDSLKANYYDEGKILPEKLIEAAVRGAASSLDPYTVYMDEASIEELRKEALDMKYGGIGARVSMRKDKSENKWLTIEEPIFSGPAYQAGLRSNDRIVEVEGETTVNRELGDLVRKLRGKPGSKVAFKVFRRGWLKEKEYTITREEIQMESTTHRLLPGGLGYIKLATFGEKDIDLVEKAIKDMPTMKALIFDLRGNTGGYLRTAHKIASFFLDKGKMIVYTKSRGVDGDKRLAEGTKLTDVPIVMLVDEGSASASEILAGALQDHHRAVLVGEKTFGKGSVQDLKFLKTTDDKAALKITIAKWYLPSGRSVEKDKHADSGVVPDIKAAPHERDFWKDAEFERMRAGDEIDRYLRDHEDKDRFRKIAESDGGDLSLYPGFDALYESLKTRATKDDVRELVREFIRKKVADDQGKALYLDLETDVVLQRGILEACKLASVDAKGVREYEQFAKAPAPAATATEK